MRWSKTASGALVGMGLLCTALWWSFSGAASPARGGPPPSPIQERKPEETPREGGGGAPAASNATGLPGTQQEHGRLLREQLQRQLGNTLQRLSARMDFAMTPGRMLESMLARRCAPVRHHAGELAADPSSPPDADALCRALVFAALQERFGLPGDITAEQFWSTLPRIDAEYERLVVSRLGSASPEALAAAHEQFREARRRLAGEVLERAVFGLSDEVYQLGTQVEALVAERGTPLQRKVDSFRSELQRMESEHHIPIASVLEPIELARFELRIREASGPVGEDERRAVLGHYAGADAARSHLEYQQERQARDERLDAFNREREQALRELAASGLTAEQLRQRMPELDQRLLRKHQLQ